MFSNITLKELQKRWREIAITLNLCVGANKSRKSVRFNTFYF